MDDQQPAPQSPSVNDMPWNQSQANTAPAVEDLPWNKQQPSEDEAGFFPTVGRIMHNFSDSASSAFQASGENGMFSEKAHEDLVKRGWINAPGETNLGKSVAQGVYDPAALLYDTVTRPLDALFAGYQGAASQEGQAGRDIALLPEAFPFGVHGSMGIPHNVPLPEAVSTYAARVPEDVYMGTQEPTAEQRAYADHASTQLEVQKPSGESAAAQPSSPETPAPDIHQVARNIAPETFSEYDRLAAQKEKLGQWMRDLTSKRQEQAAADSPYAEDIAATQAKMEDASPRQVKILQSKLDDLSAKHDEWIESETAKDNPDIANVREAYQKADYRMRDLAPDVSAAYRTAQEHMPAVEEHVKALPPAEAIAPEISPALPLGGKEIPSELRPTPSPVSESESVAAEAKMAELEKKLDALPQDSPERDSIKNEMSDLADKAIQRYLPESARSHIVDDVTKKLTAAGRPKEEATAAAQLVAEHYKARSARFGGTKGTAAEMYERDGADIKTGKGKAVARELAQSAKGKIRLATQSAKATITLMKSADASTFIHETGHHWLDELMHDAEDETAPEDLKHDAQTVRKWLGAESGDIPTRAHEKFARGFERYMMEGTAPSKALAGVFAKFKQWLTAIYNTVDKLRSPISDDIRDVFDRLLSTKSERTVIAPDHEPGKLLADIHEADAEHTPPEHAAAISDIIRGEIESTAKLHAPETYDELKTATEEVGRSESPIDGNTQNATTESSTGKGGTSSQSGAFTDGRGEIAIQSGGVRGTPVANAYIRVPKRPISLADWVRQQGGMKDEGYDIQGIIGESKLRGGRAGKGLIDKNGISTDELALRAHEAGFFPEKGDSRPTVNEFLDKLTEDLKGNKQYSHESENDLAAYHAALAHNAEVDRLASELGINAKMMSKGQFWDAVAERKSREEQDKILSDMSDAHEAEMAEGDRIQKEFLESRGEAWEPNEPKTLTLEDLENERRQEEAAGRQESGASQSKQPDGGTEGEGALSESIRPSGSGVEPSGRTGAPNDSDNLGTVDANGKLGNPESDLVDKAGNIRLDNLNTPEDVNQILRATASGNDNFMSARRGVISDGQVLDLADALGMDAAYLDRRKIGQAYNAEQIVAARKLLIQSAISVRDAMSKAADGSESDIIAYAEAKARHQMIQEQVSGVTAEAGRALRAFHALEGSEEAKALGQFLEQATGKTLFQLKEEAQLGMHLDTPQKISKFINDTSRGKLKSAIIEYYVNALISGPITHARYAVGNALNALWTPLVETPIAAGIGALRGETDRVYLGESGAQLYALTKGSREGIRAATQAFKTGVSPALPGETIAPQFLEKQNAIPGAIGKAINVPSKSVAAIHSFFKALRYEQNIQGLAYRQAMKEGLEGEAANARIASLTTSPPDEMMESATRDALKELYMAPTEYHSAMGALTRFTNQNLMAKIMMPFMKIGSQITRNAFIERTPLGFADKEVRANLLGVNGRAAQDFQAAKITAGISLIGATSMAAAEGMATGDGPNDPKQRAVWLLNHKPNSIQIGSITIPYQGLGSLGMLMRFSANMTETAQSLGEEDSSKVAISALEGVTKSVLDDNFMRGAKDALDAIYHPEEYGHRYIQDFVTNWLPYSVGMNQMAHQIDPEYREAHSIMDAARAKIPFLSETLMPKRDVFGEPISTRSDIAKYANDPVVQRLEALHIGIGKLERKINGIPLTDQQYDDYSRTAGKITKMMLNNLIQPNFSAAPAGVQIQMIDKTIAHARETARNMVKFNPANVNIMQQAIQNKKSILNPSQ